MKTKLQIKIKMYGMSNVRKSVTTRLLQKCVSENFEFSRIVMTSTMTSLEYKLATDRIYFYIKTLES
jgi:hypothetical protein